MNQIANKLKEKFFGIDNQIDDILEMVEPWSKVPQCYIRPLIINLWGMTGTGKTTLVRELAKTLSVPLVEIDLGAYAANTSSKDFSYKFWIDYWELNKKPCIILIDEVHLARTISKDDNEIDRNNIRGFWSLLSDGKIVVNERIEQAADADYLFDDAMIAYEENIKEIHKLKLKTDEDSKSELKFLEKNLVEQSFSSWRLKVICKVLGLNYREVNKKLHLDFCKGIEELRTLTKDISFQPVLDFSQSLIFLSGNLDEVYPSVQNFDPDIDLEILYKESLKITFAEVKKELSDRFRPEQIGRFGNNHIIYPALNREAYLRIIKTDFKRILDYFQDFQGYKFYIDFDDSAIDLVYKEGVVPAQGARSVLTTITSLIEASVISFIAKYCSLNKDEKVLKVQLSFDWDKRILLFQSNNFVYEKKIKLKVDDLRQPRLNNVTINCAVHEAGHVLSSLLFLKSVPTRATAYSLASNNNGSVTTYLEDKRYVPDSVEVLLAQIKVGLGSMAAIEVVFGDRKFASGMHSDMKKLTHYASILINEYGVKRGQFGYTVNDLNNSDSYIIRDSSIGLQVQNLINDLYNEVKENFNQNKPLLFELSKELVSRTHLTKIDIQKIAEKYNILEFQLSNYVNQFVLMYNNVMNENIKEIPFFSQERNDV